MLQFYRRVTILLPLALILCTPLGAHSQQIIFSNLGPGDTYNTGANYSVRGPAAYGERQWLANSFTPTGSDYRLTGIDLPLALDAGNNAMQVRIMTDAGGAPGGTLDLFTLADLPSLSGVLLSAPSVTQPILKEGTPYWFALTPNSNTEARWFYNGTGAIGPGSQNSLGIWQQDPSASQGAFRLRGEVVVKGSAIATPEPGAWALFASALFAFGMLFLRAYQRTVLPRIRNNG